jgi:hypothetical protein
MSPILNSLCKIERLEFRDRCYDFLNIFAEKFSKKLAFFAQTSASFCKHFDHNNGF